MVSVTNPFDGHALPSPQLSDAEAIALLHDVFGRQGTLTPLGSHQDQNWLVDDASGRFVLKVSNQGFTTSGLHAQNAAMQHLAHAEVPFEVPAVIAATSNELVSQWTSGDATFDVRLVTFLPGLPLADFGYLAPTVVRQTAALAAQAANALSDFDHPGLNRLLQWDCRHAHEVVAALLHTVPDAAMRDMVETAMAHAHAELQRLDQGLRVGVVHADVTDANVVARLDQSRRPIPSGLIDFGDISRTWIASDPAVVAAALVGHELRRPLQTAREVLVGYHDVLPLTEAEVDAFWPLVVARAAQCVTSSEQQVSLDADNTYARISADADRAVMQAVAAIPFPVAREVLRQAVSVPRSSQPPPTPVDVSPLVAGISSVPVHDLSSTSLQIDFGEHTPTPPPWLTRHGEAQLTQTVFDSNDEPATLAVGMLLNLGNDVVLHAPISGEVVSTEPLTLRWQSSPEARSVDLVIAGVQSRVGAGPVEVGTPIATSGEQPVRVVVTQPGLTTPPHVEPSVAEGWLALTADAAPWIGATQATASTGIAGDEVMRAREQVLAHVQEHYYSAPPRIERGWRHHLFDTSARAYLDVVNNVATLGHSHPAVADAVHRQLRLLNTNSRFNYQVIAEFSQRLADLLPDPLDTVFLVSTGSEAVDLALRIARANTAANDIVAVRSAYHGWTTATDSISTSIADNPAAMTTRPPWLHTVDSPNPYRGTHRGPDTATHYIDNVKSVVGDVTRDGRQIAAFVAEALYGNAGGVVLPTGYLAGAYDAVRQVGGLCIADEVQVGYARTGETFWAFEAEGVVPDLVCLAKGAGNGMALGAVVTTREIADGFASQGSFFSSVGGSPVSCAAGLAVLDVIEREGLQENARVVGDLLYARLTALMDRHALIGTVHGKGLYLGVELVRDRETLEPASDETAAICDRMLELGVIVQPTADPLNVLKIKPPLCITPSSADFFVDTLDQVLTTGW